MTFSVDKKNGRVLRIHENAVELSNNLAEYIAELSEASIKERGAFAIALSGGPLIALMRKICEAPYNKTVDWAKWYIFWADERVVAKSHADSNYKLAKDNLFSKVGIPCKRLLDTITVKCGHCSNLSFMSTKPPHPGQCYDHQTTSHQALCGESKKGQSSSSSSSTFIEPLSSRAPFVVKPPEKKHRLPSAYNRFMKEEIQRIKAANPEIPHREAFSAAAKNWARYIPNTPQGSISCNNNA